MKTILVPIDFSDSATNAAEFAVHLANDLDARVILLHAYHIPIPPSTSVPVILITPGELQLENEENLKKEASYLLSKTGVHVSCIARLGLAVDVILELQDKADLIVMGMHGASAFAEALMGSITTATIEKASKPVLVIPEKIKYRKPKRMVFAADLEPGTDLKALHTMKELLSAFGTKFFIVNVKGKQLEKSDGKEIAINNIENEFSDVEHIYSFSENDNLIDAMNNFVDEKQADMLAIIPHHYNLIEKLFHKSITKKLAFHTHVPLLAIPER